MHQTRQVDAHWMRLVFDAYTTCFPCSCSYWCHCATDAQRCFSRVWCSSIRHVGATICAAPKQLARVRRSPAYNMTLSRVRCSRLCNPFKSTSEVVENRYFIFTKMLHHQHWSDIAPTSGAPEANVLWVILREKHSYDFAIFSKPPLT